MSRPGFVSVAQVPKCRRHVIGRSSALVQVTPPMETPDPPSDIPGASKQVVLTPHDIPRSLRGSWNFQDFCLDNVKNKKKQQGKKQGEDLMSNGKMKSSSWWFQIFFVFTPTWGDDPIWLIFIYIFQMGWNHQLVINIVEFHEHFLSDLRTFAGTKLEAAFFHVASLWLRYLIQHTAHMRQLSNIVKTVGVHLNCFPTVFLGCMVGVNLKQIHHEGCGFIAILGALYIAFQLTAADSHIADACLFWFWGRMKV